ncbi:ABC transporter substrate-binding protein [Hansschlegelia quercus]|uniref:ABC transporter substrate-binding protein n=2 Tax=Hansschlegelia quercus TaxID=2528245 RepID=A0A4V2JEH7_9HYPH|nr:ABC transporter substrate-binding protein [Hansschlegelia quercus]
MERRRFLGVAGLAAGVTVAAPAVARAAPRVKWRIASGFPQSLDVLRGAGTLFCETIAEMSDGAFTATLAGPGEGAAPSDAADAVTRGAVEAAHTASCYSTSKDPAFALGTATPFGPNTRQMAGWLRSGGTELLDAFYARFGFAGLPCGATGAQMGGWFSRDVSGLGDLKGLRITTAGLSGEVYRKLGAEPRELAGAEVYASLEKHDIDAAEWAGPYDDQKLGLQQVAKNYLYPGWRGGAVAHLFVGRAAWDELPRAYKAMARAAAALVTETTLARYDAGNPKALREIVAAGARLKPFPRDVMEAAYKASQDVFADLYEKSPDFRKIHESQAAFRNEDLLWFRVAELPFDVFIAQMQARG